MSDTLREIEKQAQSLTAEERAQLAEVLLESLQEAPLAEFEAAQDREIEERAAAYDSGDLENISAGDVFAEARRLARRGARFIAAARLEFLAEVIYHNKAQPRLGERFAAAVEEAAVHALAFPLSGLPSRSNSRRIIVKGFRFSIVSRPEPDGIVIVAVPHHARRPFYWWSRIRAR